MRFSLQFILKLKIIGLGVLYFKGVLKNADKEYNSEEQDNLKKICLVISFWMLFLNLGDAFTGQFLSNEAYHQNDSAIIRADTSSHSSSFHISMECSEICHTMSCHSGMCQALTKENLFSFPNYLVIVTDSYIHNYETPFLKLDKKPPKISFV